MRRESTKRPVLLHVLLASSLAAVGCEKQAGTNSDEAKGGTPTADARSQTLIERIGAAPGPVQQNEGPAAIVAAASGTVEVRALGEEVFEAASKQQPLYPGDQVRASEGAEATLLFPDQSTAQLAELTTVQIGTRAVTPDPASTTAVLSGVARFGVTPRAPAEGPFIVFTPAGMVITKGTVFGVGVAADGAARVGVEQGSVEVAGAVALDAPALLETEHAIDMSSAGTLSTPAAWPADDWGTWRDQADADVKVDATVAAHATAMTDLSVQLDEAYATLDELAAQVLDFEVQAAASADAKAEGAYEAKLGPMQVAMDASYLAALRLEWLTHAHAAHALLSSELYVRHPDVVAFASVEPHLHAAVLWPKRLDATAALYLEPLRLQYYVHHAQGRARASLAGVTVPEFYAQVTPPEVPTAEARAKLKFKVYAAPELAATASARALYVLAPEAGWHGRVKLRVAPPRGKVGFCVRPASLRSKAILGVKVRAKLTPAFAVTPPKARGDLKLGGKAKFALGHRVRIAPPNLEAGATGRAAFRGAYAVPAVTAKMEAPQVDGRIEGKAGLRTKAGLTAQAKGKVGSVRQARADMDTHAKAKGKAAAEARGSARIAVKAPKIRVTPPKASASVKGQASLGVGR